MKTKLATPTVLKNIFDRKIEEVAERKQQRPLSDLERAAALRILSAVFARHWPIGLRRGKPR